MKQHYKRNFFSKKPAFLIFGFILLLSYTTKAYAVPNAICQNITVQLDASGNATITAADIDNGSNSPFGILDLQIDIDTFNSSNIGDNTVTLTVIGGDLNVSTCTAIVTVKDATSLSITCATPLVSYQASICNYTVLDNSLNPTTTASSSFAITSVINDFTGTNTLNGAVFPLGTTTVIWTVTDINGGTANCQYDIVIVDNQNPIVSNCPSDVSQISNSDVCYYSFNPSEPVFTDNCLVNSITWVMTGATTASGVDEINTTNFNVGTTTIIYTAEDTSGNTTNCSFSINITDTQEPVISNFPADKTVNTSADGTGNCSSTVTWTEPTVLDNCTSGLVWTKSHNSGTAFGVGVTTVTYSTQDASGNTVSTSFDITVIDNEAPVGSALNNITGTCQVTVSASPTRTDNCAGTITATTGDYTFPHTFDAKGTYPIVWEFDDGTTKYYETQYVIVQDDQAPVPDNLVLEDITEGCELTFIIPPTATDNCFAVGNSFSATTNTPFPITKFGTTVVIWTFDDGNGNTTTQTQNVTLNATPVLGGELLGTIDNVFDIDGNPMEPTHSIAISTCHDDTSPITINLTGYTGTIIQWEKYEDGSNSWETMPMTTDSYSINFEYSTSKSTLYRVLMSSGSCYQYSTILNVHSIPPDVQPVLEEDLFNICLNEEVHLQAHSGYADLVDEDVEEGGQFNIGQFPNKWDPTQWKIDGQVAGAEWTSAGNNTSVNNWSGTNNHPVGTAYKIEYDSNDFKFGIAHGDFTSQTYIDDFGGDATTLETPIFSLIGLVSAAVEFDQAWNLHAGDIAKVELSLDGGVTYTVTLQDLIGTSPVANSWGPVPYPYQAPKPNNSTTTYFDFEDDNTSYDISTYIGYDNIRVRWTFYGTTDESTWAIDNISIPLDGAYSNLVEWTEGIGEPGIYIIQGELNVEYLFTPEAPGYHQYGATSLINECRSYDIDGTALADVFVNYSYAGQDVVYSNSECGQNTVQLNAYDNTKTANQNVAKGAYTAPVGCSTCDDVGTMAEGEWALASIGSCGTGYFTTNDPVTYPNPANDPDAIFTGEAGTHTLTWTVNNCTDIVLVEIKNCSVVNFDGVDDHIDFKKQNYDLNTAFSLEIWVKPELTSSGIQTIISKRDANVSGSGYDLRLVNNTISFKWNGSGGISSPHKIGTDRWYHIAVTHSGSVYKLYIDGILVNTTSGSSPLTNSYQCIVGAMDQDNAAPNKPVNFFNGWMDELRIWDVELSEEQIHQSMNQEIKKDPSGSNVYGEVILIDINGLPWASLAGYYRMDSSSCGYLQPNFGVGVEGKLKNITTAQEETAPLPYTSRANQDWGTDTTWANYNVWDAPNSLGVDNTTLIDWNIVKTDHNISSGDRDITVLGLVVNSGELTIMDPGTESEANLGQMLWVTHYLELHGSIDLVGESQLIQKPYWAAQYYESKLEESSIGFIERDQQGIMNSYAYNYWSPPVSKIGSGNNQPVTMEEILMDGTTSINPQPIDFGGNTAYYHADVTPTSPGLKVASAWIWKYVNKTNAYAEWEFLGNDDGTISPSEGYTMKGTDVSGSVDLGIEHQNYVYRGKPNNAPFGVADTPLVHTTFVAPADPDYPFISLAGNPFPSALDADQFIIDNQNSTDKTLYFWEHWANGTHEWALYQGGYAIRKVNNGVPAVTHADVSSGGGARSTPGAFVPVGQGFYVISSATGGDVVFKNSQRVFERETEHSGSSSVFIKGSKSKKDSSVKKVDETMRIRLGFESPDGYHRQVVASFFEGPTDGIDILYDGKAGDFLPNDAFFLQEDQYFVIQSFGEFNEDREIPISIFIDDNNNGGTQKFMIDGLDNIPENIGIYIKDYHNDGETYDIRNTSTFEIALESGEHKDRFALVFKSKWIETENVASLINDSVTIYMNNTDKEIVIQKNTEFDFSEVTLFSYLGQVVKSWTIGSKDSVVRFPVGEIMTGVYIVNIKTDQGLASQSILIE